MQRRSLLTVGSITTSPNSNDLFEAARLLVHDYVKSTGREQPEIALVEISGSVTLSWNGSYSTPLILSPGDQQDVIMNVVDYLRDHVFDELWEAWPECAVHEVIAEPRKINGMASWQCPRGHALSEIGLLTSDQVKRPRGI